MAPSQQTKQPEESLLLSIPKNKILDSATAKPNFEKRFDYFHEMEHGEPHAIRRRLILEKYPEIEKLFYKAPGITIICATIIHILQILACWCIKTYELSWSQIILIIFFFGAIVNHMLFVLYHDITHFNCFKSIKLNQILAIYTNLPQILPSAIGFGRYHRDHHTYLGHPILDPDIPTVWEVQFFQTKLKRLGYILFMPFFYGLRPYFKAPKMASFMEIVNLISCVIYGYFIVHYFDARAILYLFASTYVGLSIHPVAAHVIAEHYEFFKSQDTYSYYGWINYINFNMGYHIEHHDFPNIAWYNLPKLRVIAPEFYETLPQMDSYFIVIFKYIFDGSIGPWSRVAIEKSGKSN